MGRRDYRWSNNYVSWEFDGYHIKYSHEYAGVLGHHWYAQDVKVWSLGDMYIEVIEQAMSNIFKSREVDKRQMDVGEHMVICGIDNGLWRAAYYVEIPHANYFKLLWSVSGNKTLIARFLFDMYFREEF
jgi:hypothetical protein